MSVENKDGKPSDTVQSAKMQSDCISAASKVTTTPFSDIDLSVWKEYEHVLTDSLWILGKRDRTGAHTGDYHGNFVPQIPQQIIERFSKAGEWVVDPFSGSGTTLIEAQRLGRNCVGIELNPEVVKLTNGRVASELNDANVTIRTVCGDSTSETAWNDAIQIVSEHSIPQKELTDKKANEPKFHLAILHSPYHDIIRFSDNERCLSNRGTVDEFLEGFGRVLELTHKHLANGRFIAIVIGDKYADGGWIPLGFMCMQRAMDVGFKLKSIVVKDMQDNRAKRNQENLWRVRALRGGFYIFKHEYVLIFRK